MLIPAISFRLDPSASITPPHAQATGPQADRDCDTLELTRGRAPSPTPASLANAANRVERASLRQELGSLWYITRYVTLTLLTEAQASVGAGWDCLRAKFFRAE